MNIPLGVYEHYKGKRYRVIAIAKDEATLQDVVVYQALYDNPVSLYWIRPVSVFTEEVHVGEYSGPRFRLIADA